MPKYEGVHDFYWGDAIQPEPLQRWFMAHIPKEEMFYAKSLEHQVMFVRDTITGLLSRSQLDYKRLPRVISTHTSKSVKLPVYYFDAVWAKLILRCNFYDWKVSVESKVGPLALDLDGLCGIEKPIPHCYCEGFMSEWVFSAYKENSSKFTVELGRDYDLYTFLFLLRQAAYKHGEFDKSTLQRRVGHLKVLLDKFEAFNKQKAAKRVPDGQRMHGFTIRDVFDSLLSECRNSPGVPKHPKILKALDDLKGATQYKLEENFREAKKLLLATERVLQ